MSVFLTQNHSTLESKNRTNSRCHYEPVFGSAEVNVSFLLNTDLDIDYSDRGFKRIQVFRSTSKAFFLKLLSNTWRTHTLAPGQSGGVVLFDVVLQLSPYGEIGLHPLHMRLVPMRITQKLSVERFCIQTYPRHFIVPY